jgi:hypothetical protein
MFREELGIATISRCEQHRVQYFQEDTKMSLSFTNFFALVVSLHFQFGFRFIKSLLLKFINAPWPTLGEATTFPFIVYFVSGHGGYIQMAFFSQDSRVGVSKSR